MNTGGKGTNLGRLKVTKTRDAAETVSCANRIHPSASEDFSSLAKNLEWCCADLISLEYMTVRDGVHRLLRRRKSPDALSLVDSISFVEVAHPWLVTPRQRFYDVD